MSLYPLRFFTVRFLLVCQNIECNLVLFWFLFCKASIVLKEFLSFFIFGCCVMTGDLMGITFWNK